MEHCGDITARNFILQRLGRSGDGWGIGWFSGGTVGDRGGSGGRVAVWGGEMEEYGLFCNSMGLSRRGRSGLTFNHWFFDKDVWKGFGY